MKGGFSIMLENIKSTALFIAFLLIPLFLLSVMTGTSEPISIDEGKFSAEHNFHLGNITKGENTKLYKNEELKIENINYEDSWFFEEGIISEYFLTENEDIEVLSANFKGTNSEGVLHHYNISSSIHEIANPDDYFFQLKSNKELQGEFYLRYFDEKTSTAEVIFNGSTPRYHKGGSYSSSHANRNPITFTEIVNVNEKGEFTLETFNFVLPLKVDDWNDTNFYLFDNKVIVKTTSLYKINNTGVFFQINENLSNLEDGLK